MKTSILYFSLFILIHLSFGPINAQCNYNESKYEVKSELNIIYGEAIGHDQVPVTLRMNIYKPKDDYNTSRPLMVWVHGGGWFGGKKEDMNALCKEMASRGFVSATISYRLGFERARPLAYPFIHDEHEMTRALYRAMQDTKGAIRFLKNRHLEDSIDIDQVFVGGGSAGGFTALAATYTDVPDEKPESANMQSTINRTDGNVERPDLGSIYGDLNLGQSHADVKGVINIFGGFVDLDIMNNNRDKFAFFYHQTEDPIVPCTNDRPYWSLPFVKDNYPIVYGSCDILDHLEGLNWDQNKMVSLIHDGEEHAIHDTEIFVNEISSYLNKAICGGFTATNDFEKSYRPLSPNPAVNFTVVPKVKFLNITNLNGQTYDISFHADEEKMRLDLSALNSGIYIVSGMNEIGKIITWRLVKMN